MLHCLYVGLSPGHAGVAQDGHVPGPTEHAQKGSASSIPAAMMVNDNFNSQDVRITCCGCCSTINRTLWEQPLCPLYRELSSLIHIAGELRLRLVSKEVSFVWRLSLSN